MHITLNGMHVTVEDVRRAKRRILFAKILQDRPKSELELLLEREPVLIDLELTGCLNGQEYRDIIIRAWSEKR